MKPIKPIVRIGIVIASVVFVLLLGWLIWGVERPLSESGEPRILYLSWEDGEEVNQLYVINADGTKKTRLTDEPLGVWDFAVAPDGTQIVYSVMNEAGGTDLWRIEANGNRRKQILDCQDATCTKPVWAADGGRLIYERRTVAELGGMPDRPQLWWLDTQTEETIPVFEDEQRLGYGARISPNGRYLSYIAPGEQAIYIVEIATGEEIVIPSQTGERGTWSLDSEQFLVNDIQFQGEQFSIHLFSTDVATAALTNLSGADLETNDSGPVFSPDGEWLAFSRKKPQAPMGRQLWLMRPDGSDATAITENADMHYNNPAWSPDGSQIAVQGFFIAEPESLPGLWLVDVETGELEEFESPGIQPAWLP